MMNRLQNKLFEVCFVKKLIQPFSTPIKAGLRVASWKPCCFFPLDTAPNFADLIAKFIFCFLLLYAHIDEILTCFFSKGKGVDFQAIQSKNCAILIKIT